MTKQLNEVCLRDFLYKQKATDKYGQLIMRCLHQLCPRDHDPKWKVTEEHVRKGRELLIERYNKAEKAKAEGKGEGLVAIIAEKLDTMQETAQKKKDPEEKEREKKKRTGEKAIMITWLNDVSLMTRRR